MEMVVERFEHGGDIYTHKGVLDFSASINPLGMPPASVEAIREHAAHFDVYPDREYRELRAALAEHEGVRPEQVICTAGASDLFQRLCFAVRPQAAMVTAPCFSGYEEALEQNGIEIVRHELKAADGFDLTDSILGFGQRGVGILFLCNPNNPTGLTIDRDLLVRILDEARETNVLVALDECFLGFTHEESAVPLCDEYPNLLVMSAFTKLYAMAGLRLGYGICSDVELLERLEAAGQPWAVSEPAQVAGIAALGVSDWAERTRAYVDEQRALLERGLEACGMRHITGEANYLMFQCDELLYEPLLEKGFLIRRCENFVGLDSSWYRIAVRTEEENKAFLAALSSCVKKGQSPFSASGDTER